MPAVRPILTGFALFALLALLGQRAPAQLDPWDDPARVLVVFNTAWPDADGDGTPDSTELAQYYAQRRGVPAGNLLGLPLTPTGHAYGSGEWSLFLTELRDPLLAWLAAHGTDSVDTLLFCHGVPYEVNVPGWGPRSVDNALQVPQSLGTAAAPVFKATQYPNPMKEPSPHKGNDVGHFDHATYEYLGLPLYMACRLDGVSVDHARALIDRAAYGAAHAGTAPGLYTGNGYVDSRFGAYDDATLLAGYPFTYADYALADKQMAYAKFFVEASGFPMLWEPWESEIGEPGASFLGGADATWAADALLYGGWYNYAKYQHGWEWLTGSIACDLNSNSAMGLRQSGYVSFLAQALQENLTAGAGVVAEPYLNGHNRPDVLLAYVLDGFTWAEAAMISDPGLKWMSLHVGDPLYRLSPSTAVPDTSAPAPWPWLGADHASLELELPVFPIGLPGGAEVFRCTALTSGPAGALATVALAQPDDRRQQRVSVPALGGAELTLVSVGVADPSGNAGGTALLHFLDGAQAPSSARVAADTLLVGPTDALALRCSFGAQGGLLTAVTGFSMTITAPAFGVVDYPIHPLFLSLASDWLVTRSVDQANFRVVFPRGAWPPGDVTLKLSLTANGLTATDEVAVTVQ
jgi:uncharacterized protein (TIGR03790 family)